MFTDWGFSSLLDFTIKLQQLDPCYFPPHFKHVTTLPCETFPADTFDFQQVSGDIRGHVQLRENRPDIRRS